MGQAAFDTQATRAAIAVGIDVGGTFTDAIVIDVANGACLDAFKVPSSPGDPSEAVMVAVARIAERHRLDGVVVCHGTTIGTNTLIERKGAKTALVTTKGFRDVLALRRQARPALYTFDQQMSEPLVAADWRLEAEERCAPDGSVIAPLADPAALAEQLAAGKVAAVAVSFLHAYALPVHEQAMAEALRQRLPGVFVTLSSDVAPEIREFERTSTAVVNAYIGPAVRSYIERLNDGLAAAGAAGLKIVKSSGGLTGPENAAHYPVHLVESGPAAGLIASARFGRAIGKPDVIAFDMGGTTAKVGVVVGGEPRLVNEFYADALVDGRPVGGYPILSSLIDIVEVGAGGGSLAWIDAAGVLKVGPQSAGARPGPACYGLGGTRPTVTDAHAVIGTLRPESLSRASVDLDPELARVAIETHIAEPMGWDVARAAHAILDIAVANMAEMVRLATLRRGLDPRDFILVPSGGAGPLHAIAIAREVGMRSIVVPSLPGMFSALGAALAPVRHDVSQSLLALLHDIAPATLAAAFDRLGEKVDALMAHEADADRTVTVTRLADLRFRGQLSELKIPLGLVGDPLPSAEAIEAAFRAAYREEYGFDLPRAVPELVNVRLVALAEHARPDYGVFEAAAHAEGSGQAMETGTLLGADGTRRTMPFLQADALAPGESFEGEAVVGVQGATIWISGSAHTTVAADGSLHIDLNPEGRQPGTPAEGGRP